MLTYLCVFFCRFEWDHPVFRQATTSSVDKQARLPC